MSVGQQEIIHFNSIKIIANKVIGMLIKLNVFVFPFIPFWADLFDDLLLIHLAGLP